MFVEVALYCFVWGLDLAVCLLRCLGFVVVAVLIDLPSVFDFGYFVFVYWLVS